MQHLDAVVSSLPYSVLDGYFGHHRACRWRGRGICTALSFSNTGPMPDRTRVQIWPQAQLRQPHGARPHRDDKSKARPDPLVPGPTAARGVHAPLNMGTIVKLNRRTQAHAHVSLCRSALTLTAAILVDSDGLRCQIALHFRDAKQYWGLEDCMSPLRGYPGGESVLVHGQCGLSALP